VVLAQAFLVFVIAQARRHLENFPNPDDIRI